MDAHRRRHRLFLSLSFFLSPAHRLRIRPFRIRTFLFVSGCRASSSLSSSYWFLLRCVFIFLFIFLFYFYFLLFRSSSLMPSVDSLAAHHWYRSMLGFTRSFFCLFLVSTRPRESYATDVSTPTVAPITFLSQPIIVLQRTNTAMLNNNEIHSYGN